MSAETTDSTEAVISREIVSTRLLGSKRDDVFRAFADPDHLARWWGPKGFTNTFEVFDFRPGGTWRFVMHGPDGTNHQNESVFVEIAVPERVVFDHVSRHRFRMTITLEEEGGKTRITWRMLFESAAECDKVRGIVVGANEQNFDRLEAELARML